MPGRPSKPLSLVQGHRTKAEKSIRQEAESKLITGTSLKEWPEVKNSPVAHERFMRVKKLLKKIDKDDALHEPVINRYCLLIAECHEFELEKEKIPSEIKELREMYQREEISPCRYLDEKNNLHARVLYCDKKIMDKRKMLLDIERESLMTIASALRSIPKKPEKKEQSKMAAMLEKRQAK